MLQYIQYLRMPPPLIILGGMYILYAAFHFVTCIRLHYWRGIFTGCVTIIKKYYLNFLIMLFMLILVIFHLDFFVAKLCKDFYNINFYTSVDFFSSMGEGWFIYGLLFLI